MIYKRALGFILLFMSWFAQAQDFEVTIDLTVANIESITLSEPELTEEAEKVFQSLSPEEQRTFIIKRTQILQLIAHKIINHKLTFSTFLVAKEKLKSAIKIQTYNELIHDLYNILNPHKPNSMADLQAKRRTREKIFQEGLQEILERIDTSLFGLSDKITHAVEMRLDSGVGLVFGVGVSKYTTGFGMIMGVSIVQKLDGNFEIIPQKFIETSRAYMAHIPSLMVSMDLNNTIVFESDSKTNKNEYTKKYLPFGVVVLEGDCTHGIGFACGLGAPPIIGSFASLDFKSRKFHIKSFSESVSLLKETTSRFLKRIVKKYHSIRNESPQENANVCTFYLN